MDGEKKYTFREKISWATYDWANSVFATTVLAGFFPLFFKSYWGGDLNDVTSTAYLGTASSISGFIIVLIAPILGAMADLSGNKKKFLICFALIGILSTSTLFFISYGNWQWSLIIFGLSIIGFSGANIFYDSLLPSITDRSNVDSLFSFGYLMSYLGGVLLFMLNVIMTLQTQVFRITNSAEAIKV